MTLRNLYEHESIFEEKKIFCKAEFKFSNFVHSIFIIFIRYLYNIQTYEIIV